MSQSQQTTLTLALTRADRDLIRAYGYPFPKLEAALDAVPKSEDLATVTCDLYDIEALLGDLASSINDCADDALQERLNELYEGIEAESGI